MAGPRECGAGRGSMTLKEFLKQHPQSRVGRPTPSFPLGMGAFFVCSIVLMLRMLIDSGFAKDPLHAVMVPFGAVCLSISLFVGAVVCGKRAIEVMRWRRRGFCSFAVAEDEVLLVGEQGQDLVVSIRDITALTIHIHTVTVKMRPGFARQEALSGLISEILQPGGDGPTGRAFFEALAPLVQRLAPGARLDNTEPKSLWAILRGE